MTASRDDSPTPERFPLLAQFVAGYLHEDFVLEHKTPLKAVEAFVADATAGERATLASEFVRFREWADDRPWADVRRAFEALGGAWRPLSRAALDALVAGAVERAGAGGTRGRRRRS